MTFHRGSLYLLLYCCLYAITFTHAFAGGLTYVTGEVTYINKNMLTLEKIGDYRILERTPVRILVKKGNDMVEINGKITDIRSGNIVTLHVSGHLIADILVERR